jgi:Tfp pilus assembly protein PilO
MSFKMTTTSRVIVAALLVAGLAVAFWMLALGPKRDEASKLGDQVAELESSLARHRAQVAQALAARKRFPVEYQQLVVLGKAVPGDDDTASLLVQVNRISRRAGVRFQDLKLVSAEGAEAAPAASASASASAGQSAGAQGTGSTPASRPVSPTEVAASTLPLGASIGPAGLAVMPYSLVFDGSFFKLADFIKGLDALVKTENSKVAVNGRLVTIDGFSLSASSSKPFPALKGSFLVTTYLTPPTQGVTAGATPAAPAPPTAIPAASTIGGSP